MVNFEDKHYVPILRWRQGEYQGLTNLADSVKERVTPLLEIPRESWDFEKSAPSKSLDEHLSTFGKRLFDKWALRLCFVDSCHIPGDEKMMDGSHHLQRLFNLARESGANPIPVLGLSRSSEYHIAVKEIIQLDERGVCIRLHSKDFTHHLPSTLRTLLDNLGVEPKQVHLLIDTSDELSDNPISLSKWWGNLISQLPSINAWATFTIAGTSFPKSLPSTTFRPNGLAPRNEWLAYKLVLNSFLEGGLARMPDFGDYACASLNDSNLDPRLIDANAKIKFTADDNWFVAMGTQVKKNGREQYRALCKSIMQNKTAKYPGRRYSYGDEKIYLCANGGSTGGTSTWPGVATNHHITKVIHDLSSFGVVPAVS